MITDFDQKKGLRERKRSQTLERIAETGLRLFEKNGYDATTLESIAAESHISARTFFYYFKSKDEILSYWKDGDLLHVLGPTLLEESTHQTPLNAVLNALLKLIHQYENEKSVIVDKILNSSESLRIHKQAFFVSMEQIVFESLCKLWPDQRERAPLRMVAMIAIGTLRLAMEARRQSPDEHTLAKFLEDGFATLPSISRATSDQIG